MRYYSGVQGKRYDKQCIKKSWVPVRDENMHKGTRTGWAGWNLSAGSEG